MCWTVGSATGCGPTDLEIGSTDAMLTPSAIPGLPTGGNGDVPVGAQVTVAEKAGGTPTLWSFTTGTTPSSNVAAASTSLGTATQFNTGIAFFFANTVAYDNANGALWIWPQGGSSTASKL